MSEGINRKLTKGEFRVGIDFNPSGNEQVHKIKRAAADLIDMVEDIEPPSAPVDARTVNEVYRLKAMAQTDIETAAMHAVKAATKR